MNILFLSTRPTKPSFRFRVQQSLAFFRERGDQCEVVFLPRGFWSRQRLFRRFSNYDTVVVQKRLFKAADLRLIRRHSHRLVYDVDDAVMFNSQGKRERRRQSRFSAIVRVADTVICGNCYLADQVDRNSKHVVIVPTAVDTERFRPRLRQPHDGPVTIGWTGSRSSNRHLNRLFPILAQLAGRIQVRFMSDTMNDLDLKRLGDVPFTFVPWSAEVEISETSNFDIGVMPLSDDPWTRGKCGFKALQYMALGIPAVCSPVGVNSEIIEHGRNGFLPRSPDEWLSVLIDLVDNPGLQTQIGNAGRQRVEEAYALSVQAPRMVEAVGGTGSRRRSA